MALVSDPGPAVYNNYDDSSSNCPTSSPRPIDHDDLPLSPPKPRKRVNFSLSPATITDLSSSPKGPTSTPVRQKSILKASTLTQVPSPKGSSQISFGLDAYCSFTAMLHAMCAALGADDKHTKLDIYLTLNSAIRGLKAYPDSNVLVEKTPLLVNYIKRDIEFPSDSLDGCESRVMIQAFKLFSFLCSNGQVVHVVDASVAAWILNKSVSAIENPEIKKSLLTCHLSFLASQRLASPKIFTHEHANRVLDASMKIHTRSKGIEGHCYHLFETLLDLAPAIMLARADDWVGLVIQTSFSGSSAMQSKAIIPLRISSRLFLGSKEFSQTVHDALMGPTDEGVCVFDSCYRHIEGLFKNKHEDHVLHLWETLIVLLMCWGKRPFEKLDKWQGLNRWLEVFRRCINSTDLSVRSRAILAWQKLGYVWLTAQTIVNDTDISKRRMGILLSVFKFLHDSRPDTVAAFTSTFSKFACLILRPGLVTSKTGTSEFATRQSEFAWQQLVVPVISDICLQYNSTFALGTTLLQHTLVSSGKSWSPKSEADVCFGTVAPEDIPGMNSKWTRSNAEKVLDVVSKVFAAAKTDDDRKLAMNVWTAFLKNVHSVMQREVRQSAESTEAIAAVCNFLKRYLQSDNMIPETFEVLVTSSIDMFGIMTFTEKPFANDDYDNFVPIGSPSRNAYTGDGVVLNINSPLIRLMRMLVTSPVQIPKDSRNGYESCVSGIAKYAASMFSSQRKMVCFLTALLGMIGGVAVSNERTDEMAERVSGADCALCAWTASFSCVVEVLSEVDIADEWVKKLISAAMSAAKK
ncbi:Rap1-interacting factor 1 N terminal-domain-containing protein [Lipomyces arxii]|uniref:Rap1-interacting factor 1 N terminal-domain-containing protein n=1 Tax=Lipomyces arxii TaxID=56418 RepID=UPI0034CF513D